MRTVPNIAAAGRLDDPQQEPADVETAADVHLGYDCLPSPRQSSARPLVLVVEDDDETRAFMVTVLQRGGIDVIGAHDSRSALIILDTWTIDAVTLDLGLPDGDGFDVCTAVRQRRSGQSIPVLAVTAKDSLDTELEAIIRGIDDLLVKPVGAACLVGHVHDLLARRR